MKTFVKVIIVVVVLAAIAPIFVYRFVFNGAPRDLGIKYSEKDYLQTHEKFGVAVAKMNSSASVKESLVYSGKKDIKITLNDVEITSYLNAENWAYAPISNLQVKINQDNTGEISGTLNLSNILPYVSLTTSTEEVDKAIKQFKISGNPPFYATGTVSVVDNVANLNFNSLEIGRIPVPVKYIKENSSDINRFASSRIQAVPNLQVRSLSISGGKVELDATVPEKVIKWVK